MMAMSRRMVFGRVGGKTEDVAGERDDPLRLPGKQHLPVLGDLVLTLLGGGEIVGIDVLQADENAGDARPLRLFDEAGDLVAERVDLDHQPERDRGSLAQLDQPVEDRFPFLVAREIVVGDEELADPDLPVATHELLDVVGGAVARLAALHIDDRAEGALVRAAAAGVEAGALAERARHVALRQERHRCARQRGQVGHGVVERCEPTGGSVLQDCVEPVLGFAREHRDTELAAGIELDRLPVEHREASGDVEPAHGHRDAGIAERAGDVEGARILVGLDADQRQQAEVAMRPKALEQHRDLDPAIGLVDGIDVEDDIRPEDLPFGAIRRNAHRPPPANWTESARATSG